MYTHTHIHTHARTHEHAHTHMHRAHQLASLLGVPVTPLNTSAFSICRFVPSPPCPPRPSVITSLTRSAERPNPIPFPHHLVLQPPGEDRCLAGLSCVAEGIIPYASYSQFLYLSRNHSATADPRAMGVCRRLTQADCGQLWRPCGRAAAKLKCSGAKLQCGADAFCASPGDTRLGAPRCLPLPYQCGRLGRPCCPANKGGFVRERSKVDRKTPVPFCHGDESMCVWVFDDFDKHGTAQFPESPGKGTRVQGWGSGYRVQGSGFGVQGAAW